MPGWDIAGRALSDPAFSLRVMRPNHEHRVSVIADGIVHYQDLGQVTPHVDPVTVAELLANFTIFTTTVGPRWFGTSEAEIRAQIDLGARIFAEGVRGSSYQASPHAVLGAVVGLVSLRADPFAR